MRPSSVLLVCWATALASAAALSHGGYYDHQLHPRRILMMNGGHIDTTEAPQFHEEAHPSPKFAGLSIDERIDSEVKSSFLLHVSSDPADRESLKQHLRENHQIELLEYFPHNTFAVESTHRAMMQLLDRDEVHWIGNFASQQKLLQPLATVIQDDDVDPLALLVGLVRQNPPRSDEALDEVRDEILGAVSQANLTDPDSVRVEPVYTQHSRVMVYFGSADDRDAAIDVLLPLPQVILVEVQLPVRLGNKWGRGIIQDGLTTPADYADPQSLLSTRHGLHGESQVVGIADSGLDVNNCFFSDLGGPNPFVPFTPTKPTSASLNAAALAGARKVISYVPFADDTDTSDHGTHVSGSVGGLAEVDSADFGEYAGTAYNAKLAFFDIGYQTGGQEALMIPNDVGGQMFEWAYLSGARIHTNSWGSASAAYTTMASDFDAYMFEKKDFLVLVAAGNSGDCLEEQTIGSPATAKSVISVGASMSNQDAYTSTGNLPPFFQSNPELATEDNLAYFSSIGPTTDGRVKPDVVSPGYGIWSARNKGGGCAAGRAATTKQLSGTSMATPLLAGSLALVRQYFTEGFFPTGDRVATNQFEPSNALMKAMAVASAVPITGARYSLGQECTSSLYRLGELPLPNVHVGWGRSQLNTAMEFADESDFHLHVPSLNTAANSATFGDDSLSTTGEQISYSFCVKTAVEKAAAPLVSEGVVRVALAWSDAPGNPGAGVALVNDLDLEVTYKGQTYLGNGAVDRLNPTEVVSFPIDSSASDVVVTVKGAAINVGPQPFAVVLTGAVRRTTCANLLAGGAIADGKGDDGGSPAGTGPDAPAPPLPGAPAGVAGGTATGRAAANRAHPLLALLGFILALPMWW